jgi:pimeloyl-ACP methyl ester carboxylesterase
MAFSTRRFAVPGGISVVGDVGGDASHPPVILQHGGGQTRHSWGKAMVDLVADGYYVLNLDARGHGDSDWAADGDYSLEALSMDLLAIIATLSSAPGLVGASMGGACSLYTVGTSPTRIASALVLVDIVPRVGAEGAAKIGAFMHSRPEGFATLDEAADAVSAYNPNRPRPRDVSGLMKNLRLRSDGRLHWHWDPQFLKQDRSEPAVFARQLLDAAGKIAIPTLLVRGMQSDVVTDEGIEELRQKLPALEVYDVSGAGHMVAGDRNDAFDQGVISFLRRWKNSSSPG